MRGKLLTLVATAAILVGGLVWADTADAQRRGWYRGGYYRAPAVSYYRPYYAYPYSYSYYRPYSYPYSYSYYRPYGVYRYSYGYPGVYGGYYGGYPGYYSSPGVYLGGRNAGVYFRF